MINTLRSGKEKGKVVAAIIAGVTAFIAQEESERQALAKKRRPTLAISLWAALGREEIMRMRTMWQRRMV